MRKLILLFIFVLSSFFAFSREGGNLLFQLGIGGTSLEYGNSIDDAYESSVKDGDGTRISLYLDLLVGYSFLDYTYLALSVSGVGDRVETSGNWKWKYLQTNSYLYALGIRTFPLKTGLYLGGDFGFASMVMQADFPTYGVKGTETIYDEGYGVAIKLGYDFDSNYRGPSISFGTSINYFKFEANDRYDELDYFAGSLYIALNLR